MTGGNLLTLDRFVICGHCQDSSNPLGVARVMEVALMRRIVLVLVAAALLVAIAFASSAIAQMPPDVGCKGIENAVDTQEPQPLPDAVLNKPGETTVGDPPPIPSQGEENSAVADVGNQHRCKL
jgi:hypothetical protein